MCNNGAVKLSEEGGLFPNEKYIQFCHDGEWHSLCTGGGTWSRVEANVVCRQLGLSGQDMGYKLYMSLNYNYNHQEPRKEVIQHQQLIHPTLCLVTHPGGESNIGECRIHTSNTCSEVAKHFVDC